MGAAIILLLNLLKKQITKVKSRPLIEKLVKVEVKVARQIFIGMIREDLGDGLASPPSARNGRHPPAYIWS